MSDVLPISFPSKGNRFTPIEVLGRGTYGVVYKCNDTDKNRLVAIKVARAEPAYRRSACNEWYVLFHLRDNASVVQIFETYEENGHICIVMELLKATLHSVIRGSHHRRFRKLGGLYPGGCFRPPFHAVEKVRTPFSLDDIRGIAEAVLQVLLRLHEMGVIHCDIKPENIMFREEKHSPSGSSATALLGETSSAYAMSVPSSTKSKVCVIDYGAVRWLKENSYFDIQSLPYRAPEVLRSHPYDEKIDEWSLGCVLYELYTGKQLFAGSTPDEQLRSIETYEAVLANAPEMDQTLDCRPFGLPSTFQSSFLPAAPMDPISADGHNHVDPRACGTVEKSELDFHDLCRKLLHTDPRERLSCQDALQHPFFQATKVSGMAKICMPFSELHWNPSGPPPPYGMRGSNSACFPHKHFPVK